MYLLDGLKFDINISHTIEESQYPAGWFQSVENRAAVGITEVPDPEVPDPELFDYVVNPDGSLRITARSDDDLAARNSHKLQGLKISVISAAQQRLDSFARERGYDSILSACSYATSNVTKFAREAQDCVNLRDETWAVLYLFLDDITTGKIQQPTDVASILGILPELVWSTP